MTETIDRGRRRFLQAGAATAGALVIGFHLPIGGRAARATAASGDTELVNAWLRISPDNTVTVTVPSSEMGQGVYTALPMLVAEELAVDWRDVRAEMAPVGEQFTNRMFNMQATGGSTSVRWTHEPLRRVGAQAREVLRKAAASEWGVEVSKCRAEAGRIHGPDGQALTYGELAGAAGELPVPEQVTLKPRSQWTLLGTPAPRLDVPAKTNGSAEFGIDVTLDGMLVGAIRACPTFGGRLDSVDEAPALDIPGVQRVIRLDDAVIVLASGYWPAQKGVEALKPEWDPGANAELDNEAVSRQLRAGLASPDPAVGHDEGDAASALETAARRIEADYEVPYLAHATMEPMNATVHVRDDGVEVWAPTQSPGLIPVVLSQAIGADPDRVAVHTTFLGGGFGRRFEMDFVVQAALASRAAGAPVKLIWSREEDVRHDFYRPAAAARLRAGVDDAGNPTGIIARVSSPSIWARVNPQQVQDGLDHSAVEGLEGSHYRPTAMRVEYALQDIGVPVGFWRSVGHSHNAFFMESFIDEWAEAAGKDPAAMRRALLPEDARARRVLDRVVALAGWGETGAGRFQGLALHTSFGSIVGEVAELSVDDADRITLHKVSCVVDCGTVVNPDTIEAQVESAVVYGLTAAMYGEMTLEEGAVQEGNFDTYRMVRLSQMPAIATEVIAEGDDPGGLGEPGTPPIAPALANALYAATGKRIRSLPLTRHGFELA
ncbi:molybdopterin cofactor-binding domain-containing protein [Arhodomonas sp. AD133]|uniref:xanthine dehydrogenase family protein molybdopterin-binding subunit n=1 Tax=Arhodomonas sp. AD133 TaxID=3415009 RepID=UPI003EBBA5E6